MIQIEDTAITAVNDSLAAIEEARADSLEHAGEQVVAMVFDPPEEVKVEKHETPSSGLSWLLLLFLALFVVISLRFRKNTRFFVAMINELTGVRERQNIFDDTVREVSFLLMLNVLWCLSAGVLLLDCVEYFGLTLPALPAVAQAFPIAQAFICIGVAVAYTLFMVAAYFIVGFVFSDPGHTESWIKGFLSAQGLDSLVLFPLALLSITLPGFNGVWLIVAGIAFAVTKIIFIYKGFRIFFSETASWVIFLYYLCSLEIVPLILSGVAAFHFCSLLA